MNPLPRFARQFGANITLNPRLVVQKANRFFLLNSSLQSFAVTDFFYAGLYLGKVKSGVFFPSFNLLNILADSATNRIVLTSEAAWLFICKRDILKKSIVRFYGSGRKNTAVLVQNEFGECLGFGRIIGNLSDLTDLIEDNEIVVKNVLDLGDFLRRER
jgi:ribosome biogenesis protein Nip4